MKKFNNITETKPVAPTYLVSGVNVVKIVKLLFDPEQCNYNKYVIEDALGEWQIEEDENAKPFSTLPLHKDTVAASVVYYLFKNQDFDREATLHEFDEWGITKVCLAPFCDKVISMDDFLDGVLEHFVSKGKDYLTASSKEKVVIFK